MIIKRSVFDKFREILKFHVLFLILGESGVDQLVEIIKILGTPNREQIDDMNPQAAQQFRFPPVRPHPWSRYFRSRTPQSVISLITAILEFSPQKRIKPIVALNHEFFKELQKYR